MTDRTLKDCVILVVEDEYLLAQDLCAELAKNDAVVLGPAANIAHGLTLVQESDRVSGAILDINLRGESVFALADELMASDVPFVFSTGYDASIVPPRFDHIVRCQKPVGMAKVIGALGQIASI